MTGKVGSPLTPHSMLGVRDGKTKTFVLQEPLVQPLIFHRLGFCLLGWCLSDKIFWQFKGEMVSSSSQLEDTLQYSRDFLAVGAWGSCSHGTHREVKKKNVSAQPPFFFSYGLESKTREWWPPQWSGLPPSINPTRQLATHMPRGWSLRWILNSPRRPV